MAKGKRKAKQFKISSDPNHFLEIAKSHLKRVQNARVGPDWSDLGTYGLYCLEALVRAAALKAGAPQQKAAEIEMAFARLMAGGALGMGELFKAIAIAAPKLGPLPGFETAP